jgi:hypothetical protein
MILIVSSTEPENGDVIENIVCLDPTCTDEGRSNLGQTSEW